MKGGNDGSGTLHGNAPDRCPVALLVIDMISDFEFPDGDRLFVPALRAARRIARLAARARAARIPVVFVNDNFGRWRSSFEQVYEHAARDDVRGHPIARLLPPQPVDYFVLKPKHSGFYETTLALLLGGLGTRHLVLTGVTADICVQFTAGDAYLREFGLSVPSDCVASARAVDRRQAIAFVGRVLKADTTESARLRLPALLRAAARRTRTA